ncbi:hypothetical protein Bca52824_044015 [Brassica carinata]|uniref:Uncharacterized protein n=1 Tax=Brassica carinata TaxID=52824 RepID=A0A8X7V188_BRACI|nr:hypothetical protein Bca52824_044015 [Brassica carinata]
MSDKQGHRVLALVLMWLGNGNYQSYVQDPIGTSDMVCGQETTQTSEQQVAKPRLESLPKEQSIF